MMKKLFNKWSLISSIFVFILVFNYLFSIEFKITPNYKLRKKPSTSSAPQSQSNQVVQQVISSEVRLPIKWADLGKQMVENGTIDKDKFTQALGTLPDAEKKLLEGTDNGEIVMNMANSRVILDLLWAFGLANKNPVLEQGDIAQDPKVTPNLASTGGWGIAKGNPMDHYTAHAMVALTADQQKMVEDMAKGIFRPCCNNSTYFPDCNHGMAMLGLLELLAANNISKEDAYKIALDVNSIWFPQTYQDLAVYFAENGTSWDKIDAKTVLGPEYSSASGYKQTRGLIKSLPQPQKGGGGCGI